MLTIDSPQNATFKKLLSLTTAKGLKKEGLFLLSGEKLVREFLAKPNLKITHEIVTRGMKPQSDASAIHLAAKLFNEIDVLGTHSNILVLEQPDVAKLSTEALKTYTPKGLEVVIPIGDPGNLGALLRSCEAFGIARVILTQEAANPFLPKAVKASAGSVLRLPLSLGPALREFPASCIALDAGGEPIDQFTWPQNCMLAVGEEGSGFGKAKFTQRLGIPMQGVESLNAVVAASIALAHRAMQR
jgi:RNA methyltransferase, TrmH family